MKTTREKPVGSEVKQSGCFTGLFISLLLFTSSCTSVYQLSIDVQEPAPVTLPLDITTVLTVDNSAKQPDNQGIVRTYNGKRVDDFALDLDSVVWKTIYSLSSHIYKSQFFNSFSFYRQSLRDDNDWLTGIALSPEFRKNTFETQGFDGIFSIDRSLVQLEGEIKNNTAEQGFNVSNYVDYKLVHSLTCSIYLYDRETPFTTFTTTDSLIYKGTVWGDSLFILKELPEILMEELAYDIGKKLAYSIIPAWTTQNRTLYSGQSARMKEAFVFTKTGKWDIAESLWLKEFDKKTKNRDKAQIANNIAVANEMQDKLEIALRWVEKAKEYAAKGSNDRMLFDEYAASLQKRIEDNDVLNLQWGSH